MNQFLKLFFVVGMTYLSIPISTLQAQSQGKEKPKYLINGNKPIKDLSFVSPESVRKIKINKKAGSAGIIEVTLKDSRVLVPFEEFLKLNDIEMKTLSHKLVIVNNRVMNDFYNVLVDTSYFKYVRETVVNGSEIKYLGNKYSTLDIISLEFDDQILIKGMVPEYVNETVSN